MATAGLLGNRGLEKDSQEGTRDACNPNEYPAKDGEDDDNNSCENQIDHAHNLSVLVIL